jgi:hypothetical protein
MMSVTASLRYSRAVMIGSLGERWRFCACSSAHQLKDSRSSMAEDSVAK